MAKSQNWRPFYMVSLALIMGTIGTALASPLYPIYQELWQLLPSQITYIFVAYMFGCLATLLFLGRASNSFGFLRTLQAGMLFVIAGLTVSVFASNVIVLSAARFLIGIASGLITTSAMLGLIYTIPDSHKQHAPQISSIVTVIGFGLGPITGGLIAQFSAWPLIMPYLPVILGAVICVIGLFSIKHRPAETQAFTAAPHLQLPERQYHQEFYLAGITAFCAFAAFSLFASLAPSFIQDIIPWHGPLVSGATISSILLISAIAQIYAKQIAPHKVLKMGLISFIFGYITLSLCMLLQWGSLFFVSVLMAGAGHGLGLLGAFGIIHSISNSANRAAVMSTYLFIGYLGTIVPIIAVGFLTDHFGFSTSIICFCIAIGLLCLMPLLFKAQISDTA